MHFHPVALLFPRMEGEEFKEFVADIKKNGQQHKIMLGPSGHIVDGINRFHACQELKLQPKYDGTTLKGYTEEQVIAYIFSSNVRRRHMTHEQKMNALAAALPFIEKAIADEAKQKQRDAGGDKKSAKAKGNMKEVDPKKSLPVTVTGSGRRENQETNAKIGRVTGLSRGSVGKVKNIRKIVSKNAQLSKQVAAGKIGLMEAYEKIKKKEPVTEPSKNKVWITKSTRLIHDLGTLRTELQGCSPDDAFLSNLRMMVEHFKVVGGEFERWLIKRSPKLKVVAGGKK